MVASWEPKLHVARRDALAAVKAEADKHAANVLPIISEVQKAGARTLRQIADALKCARSGDGTRWPMARSVRREHP